MPVIVHIDMNCFFASCEVKKEPSLKGKKIIIGGLSNRSIVSASSYEARVDGIYTTMPKEQVVPLIVTTILVSLIKVAAIAGGVLLIKWIVSKIKRSK